MEIIKKFSVSVLPRTGGFIVGSSHHSDIIMMYFASKRVFFFCIVLYCICIVDILSMKGKKEEKKRFTLWLVECSDVGRPVFCGFDAPY